MRLSSDYSNNNTIVFIKKLIEEKKILDKDKFLANFILSKNSEKKKEYLNEIKFLDLAHNLFLKKYLDKLPNPNFLNMSLGLQLIL